MRRQPGRRPLVVLGGLALVALALGLGRLFQSQAVHADAPGASSQAVERHLTFQGRSRSYWFYAPKTFAPSPPLLVVLPGDGFPTPGVPDYELLADRQGVLLAFPTTESKWRDPSDPAFVEAVIDDVLAKDAADGSRVYLMGGSAGGFAAYRMACGPLSAKLAGAGGLFAGIVTASGGLAGIKAVCSPRHPIAIAEIHGTADPYVPYAGRPCQISADGGHMVCLPSQPELMSFWAQTDGCPSGSTSSTAGSLRTDVWAPCADGTGVELLTVDGGAHDVDSLTVGGVSPMARLWAFLTAHAPTRALAVSIASSRVVRTTGRRRLVVVLSTSASGTARLTLTQRGRRVAAGTVTVRAGRNTIRLAVGKTARPGASLLRVTLTSAGRKPVVLTRGVRVPA